MDNGSNTVVTAHLLRQMHKRIGLVEETETHVALLGGCLLLGLLLLSLRGSGSYMGHESLVIKITIYTRFASKSQVQY